MSYLGTLGGGSRLVSLWDMLKHSADEWFAIATLLTVIRAIAADNPRDTSVEEPDRHRLEFGTVQGHCEKIGLPVSIKFIADALKELAGGKSLTYGGLVQHLDVIRAAIIHELSAMTFIHVEPQYSKYFEEVRLFGKEVAEGFTGAAEDIEGAGKCLALGRSTASVFHLMRVMELGLRSLAKPLGIPYAPSWESYLTQIEKKITTKHRLKTKKWKQEEPFYRDLAGDLQVVKMVWRNPTMHIVRHYNQDEAEQIFNAVRAFMCRLAARFTQDGKPVISATELRS